MTSKVFVASLPTRFDAATGEHVPSLDLNPATEHGELVILTKGPQANGEELDKAMELVHAKVSLLDINHYDYDRGDCILMVGDPILNAVAVAAALEAGVDHRDVERPADLKDNPVTVLRWDRKQHKYDRVEIPA